MRFHKTTALIILSTFSSLSLSGQKNEADFTGRLISGLFERIIQSDYDDAKIMMADSVKTIILNYASHGDIFNSRFEGTKYLGQVYSPDSSLKIINWNIVLSDGLNQFYSLFFLRDGENPEKVFSLKGSSGLKELDDTATIEPDNWYGALYYDIQPFEAEGRTCWILLGVDLSDMFTTSKIVEVLATDKDGKLIFGIPKIILQNSVKTRILFHYSRAATMMLRISDDRREIHFDHLSPRSALFRGQYQYYGPDSSYDRLVLRNGSWYLEEDVDLRNR